MHLTARLHWISSRITAGSVAYQLFAALCMSFAFAEAAHAQTNITAPITVNTVWRAGDGPFVLSGDVRVQNGASLTIEPGTVLYMGAGSALTVQAGTLVVDGTAAQRVTITSQKVQLGQTPAKGDWAGLRFLSGASQSRLSYVDIEFGSGIAVNGARLILQNTRLRSHAGSAIAIDLASSLDGGENEATDNDINAIAVPAGDILGSVSWSLRGIPFLIGSGAVGVGASPRISSVTPATVAQGAARSVTVAGSRLRGATRPTLGAAGLTGAVVAGGTDTQLEIQMTATAATPLGATWLSLLTDAGEVRLENAISVIGNQPTIATLIPTSVFVGQGSVQLTVTGENIDPQSVVLVDGVPATTVFVNSTQVTATIANQTAAGTRQIQIRTPDPLNVGQFLTTAALPLAVNAPALTLGSTTTTVTRGLSLPLTVEIPYAAGPSGVVVSLTSNNPSVGTVPATVTIAAGQTSSTFNFSALAVGVATVTASSSGFANAQRSLTVAPTAGFSISPATSTVGVGRSATLTINSSVAAGAGGQVVNLQSSAPTTASVPPTVTIQAGASSTTANVTAVAIGTANVTATAAGYDPASATVTVRAVTLTLPATSVVAPGLTTASDHAFRSGSGGWCHCSLFEFKSRRSADTCRRHHRGRPTTGNVTISGGTVGTSTLTATSSGYQVGTSTVSVKTSASTGSVVNLLACGIGSKHKCLPDACGAYGRHYCVALVDRGGDGNALASRHSGRRVFPQHANTRDCCHARLGHIDRFRTGTDLRHGQCNDHAPSNAELQPDATECWAQLHF